MVKISARRGDGGQRFVAERPRVGCLLPPPSGRGRAPARRGVEFLTTRGSVRAASRGPGTLRNAAAACQTSASLVLWLDQCESCSLAARVPEQNGSCEWFRDWSQARGEIQRVQRAPGAPARPFGPCVREAWSVRLVALHMMAVRAAAAGVVTVLIVCPSHSSIRFCVVLRVACGWRGASVIETFVCCAPRGANGCLAGRSGRSVRHAARDWPLRWSCSAVSGACTGTTPVCVRPQPNLTLRTHVLQPAWVRCAVGATWRPPPFAGWGGCGVVRLRRARTLGRWRCGSCDLVLRGSAGYLVDPASSHMLVSKIKPCMSKYKRLVL